MKKYTLFVLLLLAVIFQSYAQFDKHSTWTTYVEPSNPKVGEEVELIFEVKIDKDWYVYGANFSEDLGPTVTSVVFENPTGYEVVGKLTSPAAKKKYEEIWGGEYTYFTQKGIFKQKIKILNEEVTIKATLSYQECSEVSGVCVLHEPDFTIKIKSSPTTTTTTTENKAATPSSTNESQENATTQDRDTEKTDVQSTASEDTSTVNSTSTSANTSANPIKNTSFSESEALSLIPKGDPFAALPPVNADLSQESESLWEFMILAFLSGLAALLTPCVFPMIPMTVSFFTTRSKNKMEGILRATIYGVSIITFYTLIGVVVSKLLGDEAANFLATHWLPNTLFFIVFIVFAVSFFGAFDIVLPSKMVNTLDKQADKGGYLGIFFMALTLVVVSFSCTGPIAGSILVMSTQGEVLKPVMGMFAFSLAFALPFTLFAIFPSWLSSLPKSGGWLNTVKVALGFIELALAFKFLSVADQVYHWGLLDRPVYIVIWMAIAFFLSLYLLGKIRLPHDSVIEKLSVSRLLLAIVSFAFFLYLLPGLFGAPLSLLSGYLPPQSTNDFDLIAIIRGKDKTTASSKARYADLLHLPHGIEGYFEYFEAIEAAKRKNQPLFIDFTGHGCVNCREMEASVWVQSDILEILKNDLTVVALYVDERTELTEGEKYISPRDNKAKTTIGKRNADFQIRRFGQNAQPNYFLINPYTHQPLSKPIGTASPAEFKAFLEKGISEFRKQRLTNQ